MKPTSIQSKDANIELRTALDLASDLGSKIGNATIDFQEILSDLIDEEGISESTMKAVQTADWISQAQMDLHVILRNMAAQN